MCILGCSLVETWFVGMTLEHEKKIRYKKSWNQHAMRSLYSDEESGEDDRYSRRRRSVNKVLVFIDDENSILTIEG